MAGIGVYGGRRGGGEGGRDGDMVWVGVLGRCRERGCWEDAGRGGGGGVLYNT